MKLSLFITGTDTGVGKTIVTGLLGRYFLEKGYTVGTQKWIQTGCSGASEDLLEHRRLMGSDAIPSGAKNAAPYVLGFASSPHLAARIEGVNIDASRIRTAYTEMKAAFDVLLVEGSGGVLVPYNDRELMIEIVKELDIPCAIVSENKLGAVNHTLLSIEALKSRGINVVGTIFNDMSGKCDPVVAQDNPDIVTRISGVRPLGRILFSDDVGEIYSGVTGVGRNIMEALNAG